MTSSSKTLKPRQLFLITSIAFSGFAVWLYIVTQIPASLTNTKIIALFFVSFLVWLASVLAFGLFQFKVRRSNREIVYAHIAPSIRQGLIAATTLMIILLLRLLRVVSWWEIILVIIGASLLELAFNQKPGGSR